MIGCWKKRQSLAVMTVIFFKHWKVRNQVYAFIINNEANSVGTKQSILFERCAKINKINSLAENVSCGGRRKFKR